MNVIDKYNSGVAPMPETTQWPVDRVGNRVGSGNAMALLKMHSAEDILTISFVPDRIVDSLLIQQIQDELLAVLSKVQEANVLLDFRGVRYLSSSSFGILLRAYKRCKLLKMNLKLCNLSPNIRDVIKVTGLDKMLDVYADTEAAVQAFATKRR